MLLTNPPHRPLRSGLCQLPPGNINICRSKAHTQGISWWRSDAHGNRCLSCFLIRGSSVFFIKRVILFFDMKSLPVGIRVISLWPCPTLAVSFTASPFRFIPTGPCFHSPQPAFLLPRTPGHHILCGAVGSPHPELDLAKTPAGSGPFWRGGVSGGGREARGRAASDLSVQLHLINPFILLTRWK